MSANADPYYADPYYRCITCGTAIYAVIHEDIGRAWLHADPDRDTDHQAELS